MRKEMRVTVIFTALAVLFFLAVEYRHLILGDPDRIKGYILAGVLLLVQTKVFAGMEESFLASDERLIKIKRAYLLLYAETRDRFHEIYRLVTKALRYESVMSLLVRLGIHGESCETQYPAAKEWLEGKKRIPYKTLSKEFRLLDKLKIDDHMSEFRQKAKLREDIFYACLSGSLAGEGKGQPIVDLILVWVSYLYFLTDVFHIDMSAFGDMIILSIFMSILDMGRHFLDYQKKVKTMRETYEELLSEMRRMDDLMQADDCYTIPVEGELIPHFKESELRDAKACEIVAKPV